MQSGEVTDLTALLYVENAFVEYESREIALMHWL
jgi:hypothetical protein